MTSALGVQRNGKTGEVSQVRDATVVSDEPVVEVHKTQELLQVLVRSRLGTFSHCSNLARVSPHLSILNNATKDAD